MKKVILVLTMTVILAGPVLARDLWDPPWDMSLPNQTYQAWEFTQDPGPFPTIDENPYGIAELVDYNGTWPDVVEGPDGQLIQTLHIDEPGGLSIWVPNNPDPNLRKLIFWQVTSDKSPTPTGSPPTTTPPGASLPTGLPQIQHPNLPWYTYNGLLEIIPNPDGEWIHFDFVVSTNIEEIVIKTICIPEPATFGLMILGGLAMLRRRRTG